MKILLLYDCVYPESLGGVEHRNHELAAALGGLGHEVTIAGFAVSSRDVAKNARVLSLGPPGKLYDAHGKRRASEALRFARACSGLDVTAYDLVETANIPYAHLLPLARHCRRAHRPLVVTWHEYWGSYWRRYAGPLRGTAFALVERATARVGTAIAVSQLTGERLAARRGRPVEVVPNGIPVARIRAAAAQGLPGPPLFLAGRLVREKRVDLLLAAIDLLRREFPAPLLAIAGDGPDAERLHQLAAPLGPHVRFLGRLPASDDVWRAMGGARIAVQPSEREGFGLFPLEAMAAGLPVVYCASPESAVEELVGHEQEGLRSTAEPAALATAIGRLLRDDQRCAALGAAAARRAAAYDWSEIAARFLAATSAPELPR